MKEKIICSVPRNRFLAMEMEGVYVTVDEREKLLNRLEKQIKKEKDEEQRLKVEQLKKWIISSVCEKDMCVGKELGLLDTENGKVPCKEECEGCDIWIVLDRIDVVFSVSPQQEAKPTNDGGEPFYVGQTSVGSLAEKPEKKEGKA